MGAVTATHVGNLIGEERQVADKNQVKRIKTVLVYTPATADDGDELTVTLSNYGLSNTGLLGIRAITHTTDNNVLVTEAPTTSVASGVLTITVGGSTDNKTRSFLLFGEER